MTCKTHPDIKDDMKMSLIANEQPPWTHSNDQYFYATFSNMCEKEKELFTYINMNSLKRSLQRKYQYNMDQNDHEYFSAIILDIHSIWDENMRFNQLSWISLLTNVGLFLQTLFVKMGNVEYVVNLHTHKDFILELASRCILINNNDYHEDYHAFYESFESLFNISFGLGTSIRSIKHNKLFSCIELSEKVITGDVNRYNSAKEDIKKFSY